MTIKVDSRGRGSEIRTPKVVSNFGAREIGEFVDSNIIPKLRKLIIEEIINNPFLLDGSPSRSEKRRGGLEKKIISQKLLQEYSDLWKVYGVNISPFVSSGDRIANSLLRKSSRWMENNKITLKEYVNFLYRFKPSDHRLQNLIFIFRFAKGDSWLQEALWFYNREKDDLSEELFEYYFKLRPGEQKEYDGKSYITVHNKMKNLAENIRAKALKKEEVMREIGDGIPLFEIGKKKASSARLYESRDLHGGD